MRKELGVTTEGAKKRPKPSSTSRTARCSPTAATWPPRTGSGMRTCCEPSETSNAARFTERNFAFREEFQPHSTGATKVTYYEMTRDQARSEIAVGALKAPPRLAARA